MDQEWLKTQFRLNPEKSKAALAEAIGLPASAVSKILAGGRQIKAAEYTAMRRFFGLPVDGERAARGASYILEPLEHGLQDGAVDQSWTMPASVLKGRTKAAPDKVRIFAVQDNAMAPDLVAGEQVLVDLSDQTPSPPGIFVISDGMAPLIRQCEYVPHSSPPSVKLSTISGRFEARIVPVSAAGLTGRVIAKLEWL